MRTIPWAQLLCPMGTARPFLRWIAAKHGTTNEPFYHQEAALPMEAEACSSERHSWAGRTPGKESVGTRRGYA